VSAPASAAHADLDRLDLADLERRCAESLADQAADAAHDLAHVRRVVASAKALAAAEGGHPAVVVPAAWLHDCVSVPKSSPLRAQASRLAADEAVRRLAAWGYPEAHLPEVHHAVAAHSFTAAIEPRTREAQVVQDADRLDALGAVGIARTLMLGGAMGRPLYDEADPFCERRPPDDAASTIDHFYTKLLHLAGTMRTASGRAEAERRTAVLRRFLDDLRRELPT